MEDETGMRLVRGALLIGATGVVQVFAQLVL
jgi:hypothetical protein